MKNSPGTSADVSVHGDAFERKKTAYFSRLALQNLSAMRLHKESGLWDGDFEDRRVTKHCLAVAARLGALSDLLDFSDELRDALMRAGALHDFHKRVELAMVREANEQKISQWDANILSGVDAQSILEEKGVDPLVRELLEMPGNLGIRKSHIILQQEELEDVDVARLAMHYIDAITMETRWSQPVEELSRDTRRKINMLDVRVDGLEAKSQYGGFNEEGRKHFDGLTTYQAMRAVNHDIEEKLHHEIWRRSGMKYEPLDLPEAIDHRLKEIIEREEVGDATVRTMDASDPLRLPENLGEFHPLMKLLVEIGDEVGAMQEGVSFRAKEDGSPVSVGDLHVKERLLPFLKSIGASATSEEGIGLSSSETDEWIIDEIDGTNPYKNGDGEYGLSIGNKRTGFLYFPARRILIAAALGKGAFINGEPVRIDASEHMPLEKTMVTHAYAQAPELRERYMTATQQVLVRANTMEQRGSTVDAFLRVLMGPAHVMIIGGATINDLAGLVPIAKESGIPFACLNGDVHNLSREKDKKLFFIATRTQNLMHDVRTMLPADVW